MEKRGFTLVEVLLVMGLILVIGSISYPVGISFFRTQLLFDTVDSVTDVLQEAQFRAISQVNDSSFGVKILSDSFVLFEGSSYVMRIASRDESYAIPASIESSGLDEIVFAQRTGFPSVTGTILLVLNNQEKEVDVHPSGIIDNEHE